MPHSLNVLLFEVGLNESALYLAGNILLICGRESCCSTASQRALTLSASWADKTQGNYAMICPENTGELPLGFRSTTPIGAILQKWPSIARGKTQMHHIGKWHTDAPFGKEARLFSLVCFLFLFLIQSTTRLGGHPYMQAGFR